MRRFSRGACVCVCGSRSSSSCYLEEWSLLVSRAASFMSSKLLSDKTRLWGDLGLRCQGHSVVCVQYICVFYAISHPSSNRASLRLLSVVPSFVSERGCDPVWRNGLLGFSLSICWKITAQATFEEVSSHPPDPGFLHSHLHPPHLFALFPTFCLFMSFCLSVFITLKLLSTVNRTLFRHVAILSTCLSACSLPLYPSISMLKYQQARICHSRGPLILFCCSEESTWKTITDCPPRAASQTDYSLFNKHTLWLVKDGFL